MFIFTLLSGLCLLFFPLQGIRDFKSEKGRTRSFV